ncbi:hypothetical protein [Sphingomonas sp.]|uniref:hypothetical protein n=1 Tax=Sphingomonas sp. TaxID=28214 RepID=UPI001EC5B71B|nr:hypothetical protein [Sphingomonas sp.]MBX3595638.1 hypothetical protein [Sphingomonas sp.]
MTAIFVILFLAAVAGIIKPYIKGSKRWHFGLAAFVAFVGVGATAPKVEPAKTAAAPKGDAADDGNKAAQGGDTPAQAKQKPPQAEESPSKWQYSEDKDEMRGDVARFASIKSENEIDLSFPYGEVYGAITVRHRKQDGLNVMFSVDKGQILCHNFTASYISVKFDDRPIQKFSCTGTSDGSSETAFITNAQRFLGQLRGARKTIIEAEFYQQGRQQFIFETAGLNWK